MLEGKELILATKKYAVEDRRRSWNALSVTVVLMVGLYLAAIFIPSTPIRLLAGVLAGLTSVRMFIIYHDYLHRTILQKSRLAELIFSLYGLFILAPTSVWRRSHDYHHANNSKLYTSSIGSFPIVTKNDYLEASPTERKIYLFIRHPLTIAAGYIFVFLWGMCLRTLVRSSAKHWDAVLSVIYHFGIGALIWFLVSPSAFLTGFLVPAVVSSALGSYLFYAQHNFPGARFKPKEEWNYVYAALHSSSFMQMSHLMHWFTGNIGYHHIHHINPRIPFYRLPEVFNAMPEFQNPVRTSLRLQDIYRCCRIKVWDPDRGKMIGLSEVYA